MKRDYLYTTSTGRMLAMNISIIEIGWNCVVTDKARTVEACKSCRMYNHRGGCPPCSPTFELLTRNDHNKHLYLVVSTLPTMSWASYNVRQIEHPSKRFLMISSFIECVYKSFEKQMVKQLRAQGGRVLPSSYCTICQKCTANDGGKCSFPQQRMYSPESLGVLVSDTMEAAGMPALEWYTKKDMIIPKYIRKVCFYISELPLDEARVLAEASLVKQVTPIVRRQKC
jgi:predicted metal-binding protein